MKKISRFGDLRAAVTALQMDGSSVALVPTLGNLHAGHISLIDHAAGIADHVICSIFVNPTQFGVGEDYENYPRTLAADCELLAKADCRVVFAPELTDIYPFGTDRATRIQVPDLSSEFCGQSRPGHFDGVAAIVTRLLLMVRPDHAIFGQKDYQQLLVIRRLAADLFLDIEIHGAPTVRHADGLAMSSRNQYLTTTERQIAPQLAIELEAIANAMQAGARNYAELCATASTRLMTAGFEIDYLAVADGDSLTPPSPESRSLVVLGAAFLGKARLIDNIVVETA